MKNLPSIVWIFIFLGGIVGLIGSIIGAFYLLANYEGVATLLLLVAGWFTVGQLGKMDKTPGMQIAIAGAITFYALMGMAIDQTGNPFFNYPLQYIFCPAESALNRSVDVTHPLPGRTDMTQDFRCVDSEGNTVQHISMFHVIGIRFLEYVIVAYVMIWAQSLLRKKTELNGN